MQGSLHTVAFGPPATALLTSLISDAKAADPFAPVTVVVPSATAGTTLRRRVAAELGGLVGVSFLSLPQVADGLAGPSAVDGPTPVVARAHIRAAIRSGGALTPDAAVAASPATEDALAVTFAELAPLDDATLELIAGAEPLAAGVVELFRRYRAAAGLAEGGHDAAAIAAARVEAGLADAAALGTLVVHLPRRVRPGEVALLGALASRIPVAAVVGRTGEPQADVVFDELVAALTPALGEARWAGGPPAEPARPTALIRAPDPAEEVAMAVREVVTALTGAPGVPPVRPERIAVVHRVRHPYAALLHAGLVAADVPHHAPAVTTLAQTVPGRVISALLDVASGGFRRADVSRLWRSGPMLDPVTGDRLRASRWDRLAREAGIGGGVEQWRARLARAVEAREAELERYHPASHVAPPGAEFAGDEPTDAEDWRILRWRELGAHIDALAERLRPPMPATWTGWAAWLDGLVTALVHPVARQREPEAFERIAVVLAAVARLDGIEGPPDLELLRRVLGPELDRPERSHGRFGHGVTVGRLVDVVGADLDLVIVVGAADGQFPPRRAEDPLLSDRARDLTAGALVRRGLRREEEHRDLLAALAAAPRRVLTAPRADPRDQRERQPAAWFVAAASDLAGRMVASVDLPALRDEPWFTDVPSFEAYPAAMARPATAAELDLGDLLAAHEHLDDDDRAVATSVVAVAHPELGRGLDAARARRVGTFDEWTGRVGPDPVLAVGADQPRSPTGLEAYAACPFRSFLGTVLRVGAIDDPTEAELISARDEGSLVHEVLETFISEHTGKPPSEPWSTAERARLDAIVSEVTDRYEGEGRTGRSLLWGVRKEHLRHQLRRVLDSDEDVRGQEQVAPVAVELAFGDAGAEPVTVTLANGRVVSFKGMADRVDRSVDGRRLVVYDYKTGSDASFADVAAAIRDEGDLTARGTKLQLPIYALAARSRFPGSEQVSSYYWFVGRKGLGKRVGAVLDARAEDRFREVIDVVVEGIEEGRFPANPGDEHWDRGRWTYDHCRYCDFDRVCPTSRGETWVRVRTAPDLARYRQLADPPPVEVEAEIEIESEAAS